MRTLQTLPDVDPETRKDLVKLKEMADQRRLLDKRIREGVAMLRQPTLDGAATASWTLIGMALGIGRTAAQKTYGS